MMHHWIICLLCLWLPPIEMFGSMPQPEVMKEKMKHDAMEMKDTAVESKKDLDEQDVTEQQFYECFADINCELGLFTIITLHASQKLFKISIGKAGPRYFIL